MDDLLQKPLSQATVVVLDTETTGLYPYQGHRVVEIGAVRLESASNGAWQARAEFSQLLQPDRPMEPAASRVNGITDADLVGMPHFADVAGLLLDLLDGALLVAHNARFDAAFLGMELHLCGHGVPASSKTMLPNPWLCTMLLARNHFYFGNNTLGHIAQVLGLRAGRAHRALNDAYVTVDVLKRLARGLAEMNLITVGDLLEAQGGPVYTPFPSHSDLPPPFSLALSLRRPVRIVYASPSGLTRRTIEPRYSTSHGGHDYLVAYCRLRKAQRTFRLDRIVEAEFEGE